MLVLEFNQREELTLTPEEELQTQTILTEGIQDQQYLLKEELVQMPKELLQLQRLQIQLLILPLLIPEEYNRKKILELLHNVILFLDRIIISQETLDNRKVNEIPQIRININHQHDRMEIQLPLEVLLL